jgi:Mce-associated membrane protein
MTEEPGAVGPDAPEERSPDSASADSGSASADSDSGSGPGPAEGPTSGPPAGRTRKVVGALTAAIAVSAVVVGWLGWQALSAARERTTRDEALAAARSATSQVLSYHVDTLDADLARSLSMFSGPFTAKFAELADNVIVPAVTQQGMATTATVIRAAVIAAEPGQVSTLLFVNQVSTLKGDPQPHTVANQVQVTMTRFDGRWLISDLQPL